MTLTSNTPPSPWRKIYLRELADVLGVDVGMARCIVGASDFPCPAYNDGGKAGWRVVDVSDWLESHGWTADARILRRWRYDEYTARKAAALTIPPRPKLKPHKPCRAKPAVMRHAK